MDRPSPDAGGLTPSGAYDDVGRIKHDRARDTFARATESRYVADFKTAQVRVAYMWFRMSLLPRPTREKPTVTIDFQTQLVNFNQDKTGDEYSTVIQFGFPTDVTLVTQDDKPVFKAQACVQSFDVEFAPFDDHNLGNLKIQLTVQNPNLQVLNVVPVRVEYLLRDWSDSIDDKYNGKVWVLLIVDRQ